MNRGIERSLAFPDVSFEQVQGNGFRAVLNLADRQVVGTGENNADAYLNAMQQTGLGQGVIFQGFELIQGRKNFLRLDVQIRGRIEQFTGNPMDYANYSDASINLVRRAIIFEMIKYGK